MVKTVTITESNACFADERHEGLVCVFMGATSGIGFATLRRLLTMVHSSTFYVLGRDPSRYAGQLDKLRELTPNSKIIFIETHVSLISGIDTAAEQIKSAEQKVDILCMSPGGMPFQGAVYTTEGLETSFAVSYYARLRLVADLLPLLHRSPNPRVLSILNGTKEKKINEENPGLENSWGIMALVNHSTILTSLAFDHLASNDSEQKLTFIHDSPGFVNTGTPRTSYPSKKDGWLWWAFVTVMQNVSGWIIIYFGMPVAESGERHAYYLTSDTYGPGSWRANNHNEIHPDNSTLKGYKERGWTEKAWEHTQRVWDMALARGATHAST